MCKCKATDMQCHSCVILCKVWWIKYDNMEHVDTLFFMSDSSPIFHQTHSLRMKYKLTSKTKHAFIM
jgi:hypothetical protein